jgi:hypothetical protein
MPWLCRPAEKRRAASYIPASVQSHRTGCRMIRFVIVLPLIVVTWLLLVKVVSDLKKANIDWTGVATFIGFIVLAFWLRHVTGMG